MRCSIYRIVRDGRYYIKNSEISQKIPMFFRYFKDGHAKNSYSSGLHTTVYLLYYAFVKDIDM